MNLQQNIGGFENPQPDFSTLLSDDYGLATTPNTNNQNIGTIFEYTNDTNMGLLPKYDGLATFNEDDFTTQQATFVEKSSAHTSQKEIAPVQQHNFFPSKMEHTELPSTPTIMSPVVPSVGTWKSHGGVMNNPQVLYPVGNLNRAPAAPVAVAQFVKPTQEKTSDDDVSKTIRRRASWEVLGNSAFGAAMNISIKGKRGTPMTCVDETLYSSIVYEFTHNAPRHGIAGPITCVTEVVHGSDAEKLVTKNGKAIISRETRKEWASTRAPLKTRIRFTSCSYHHCRARFAFRLSYYGSDGALLLRQVSPSFLVLARKSGAGSTRPASDEGRPAAKRFCSRKTPVDNAQLMASVNEQVENLRNMLNSMSSKDRARSNLLIREVLLAATAGSAMPPKQR